MSAHGKKLIEELYKPQPDPKHKGSGGHVSIGSPEAGAFGGNAAEYSPIMEYIEPEIPAEMEQHLQQSNPAFIPPQNVPVLPVAPPQMNIQPVKYPNVPLSDFEIDNQAKTNIYSAIKWLAEWCLRQIKMVQYKEYHEPK
jgi:hypothetical protein